MNQYGKESFEQKLKQAMPLSEFLFKELCAEASLQTSEGRAKLVSDAKPLLQQVAAPALSVMLVRRLGELSGISQGELEELLHIKRAPRMHKIKNAERKQPITPYRRLTRMLLYNPNYIAKLDKYLLVQCNENNEEVAALKALVNFLDTHPQLIASKSTHSILTYLQNSPYRALLEDIESETLEWGSAIDLEEEFLEVLEKLQQAQRNKRMTELHSKSLERLTDEEKRELQRLAMK